MYHETKLDILSGGISGVIYEIIPQIERIYTIEQKEIIANNLMDLVGDKYLIPDCGIIIWIIYKKIFKKNIYLFIDGINTFEKQEECRNFADNYKYLL
jgi:hypothetical protein